MSESAGETASETPQAGAAAAPPAAIRVFVIGGGCAGLSAAWQLAAQPGFEIHVFEKNPYLGGKGASTRQADGRIHEHGLHVWLGFYENAFRMMRQCYAEVERRHWGPAAKDSGDRLPHGSFEDAFFPEPQVGVAGLDAADRWTLWTSVLPPAPGLPGDPLDQDSNPFTLQSYLGRCLTLVRALLLSVVGPADDDGSAPLRAGGQASAAVAIDGLVQRLRQGALVGAGVLLQAISIFEDWLRSADFGAGVADRTVALVEAITAQVRRQLRDLVGLDEPLRWKTHVIDIVMTIVVGLYRDRVLLGGKGLDALNDIDYRTWLLRHGATPGAVESAFMRGIYDLLFAYRDGDREQPALAAGVALRGALRMFFTYRGAMFWKMRSGMGETVFSPLYKVLAAEPPDTDEDRAAWPSRPVHFHLGHALTGIQFAADGQADGDVRVVDLEFERAAPAPPGLDEFGCWPAPPAATAGGETGPETVAWRVDDHFDAVVFAAGVDALRDCGRASLDKLPLAWTEMLQRVQTVGTRSAQLWLPCTLADLGWTRGPAVISGLGAPFDTWADMSHVLQGERAWRNAHGVAHPPSEPAAVVYLCGVEPERPARQRARAAQLLHEELAALLKGRAPVHDSAAAPADATAARWLAAFEADPQFWLDALHRLVGALAGEPLLLRALADRLDPDGGDGAPATEALSERLKALLLGDRQLLDLLQAHAPRRAAAGSDGWPQAFWPRAFKREFARAIAGAMAEAHCQLNLHGSERYTLSLPRTIRYRVSPLDGAVSNLALAGDWTACGLDAGCVEAAVMSGMLAAHALSGGRPAIDEIVGFDHP